MVSLGEGGWDWAVCGILTHNLRGGNPDRSVSSIGDRSAVAGGCRVWFAGNVGAGALSDGDGLRSSSSVGVLCRSQQGE